MSLPNSDTSYVTMHAMDFVAVVVGSDLALREVVSSVLVCDVTNEFTMFENLVSDEGVTADRVGYLRLFQAVVELLLLYRDDLIDAGSHHAVPKEELLVIMMAELTCDIHSWYLSEISCDADTLSDILDISREIGMDKLGNCASCSISHTLPYRWVCVGGVVTVHLTAFNKESSL